MVVTYFSHELLWSFMRWYKYVDSDVIQNGIDTMSRLIQMSNCNKNMLSEILYTHIRLHSESNIKTLVNLLFTIIWLECSRLYADVFQVSEDSYNIDTLYWEEGENILKDWSIYKSINQIARNRYLGNTKNKTILSSLVSLTLFDYPLIVPTRGKITHDWENKKSLSLKAGDYGMVETDFISSRKKRIMGCIARDIITNLWETRDRKEDMTGKRKGDINYTDSDDEERLTIYVDETDNIDPNMRKKRIEIALNHLLYDLDVIKDKSIPIFYDYPICKEKRDKRLCCICNIGGKVYDGIRNDVSLESKDILHPNREDVLLRKRNEMSTMDLMTRLCIYTCGNSIHRHCLSKLKYNILHGNNCFCGVASCSIQSNKIAIAYHEIRGHLIGYGRPLFEGYKSHFWNSWGLDVVQTRLPNIASIVSKYMFIDMTKNTEINARILQNSIHICCPQMITKSLCAMVFGSLISAEDTNNIIYSYSKDILSSSNSILQEAINKLSALASKKLMGWDTCTEDHIYRKWKAYILDRIVRGLGENVTRSLLSNDIILNKKEGYKHGPSRSRKTGRFIGNGRRNKRQIPYRRSKISSK